MHGHDASPADVQAPDGAWRALAQLSADLLVLLDGEGRIVWVNRAFERSAACDAASALGKPLAELLGDGSPAWSAIAARLAAGLAVARTEIGWRHPNGGPHWAALTAEPLPAPASSVAVCLQDLSETHRLAERLDMAQEFGRLGVWERQIPSGEGYWDRHVFRFFGMDPAEGTPNFNIAVLRIHPDDRARLQYTHSIRAPGKYEAHYRVMLPDGHIRRIHSQWEVKSTIGGEPDRSVGVMVDDTPVYELAQSFNDTSEQLRLAVDLGNIAIWRQDLRTNRFHYNYRAFQVLDIPPRPEGLSLEEVRALIHPEDLPRVVAAASQALDSEVPVDMEARYRRSDGSWRHVLTRRVLRRDAQGQPLEFVGVALDVTDQVEKSRSAHELAKRLEIATHSAGLGIFSRDPDTERGEWNAEMFRIMGRDPALGVPSRDDWIDTIIHPDDRSMMRHARESLLESAQGKREEQYRIVRPDGEVRWLLNRARRVMDDGRPKVYGITIDVTDRVQTEAALRRANERVALTARSVGLGTWEWDPDTDSATWDDAMFRLRGREPQPSAPALQARSEMAHPEDRHFVEAVLREAAAEGRSAAYEFRVVWPDGTVRWLASRSSPLPGADGRSLRYIGVDWDITERVNAENERRERMLAQRESEAKSQFLARMSHELRTPLNAVLGFAQLLQLDDGRSTPAEQRNRVDHIRTAGEHLLSLINDVLDLSSLETGEVRLEMQPVHLADLVADVLPLVMPLARSFGIKLLVGDVSGVARGDPTRLRQVLINLLSNAIKYNRPGGEAWVEGAAAAGRATLRVRDTGRGLDANQRSHLFEPFNRLGIEREGIEGTGIGLAIVKALVERMEGGIAVSSEPGVGTLFEVSLPQGDAGAPTEWRSAPTSAPVERIAPTGQLLYIEDNPINVMVVEELVASRSDLRIVSEPNGELGIARARELKPDLILVDMQLPDIDGFEVLRRLRAQPETAQTPCVVLSANAMPDDITRALAAGFAEYWTKPIDFNAFLVSLDTLLKRTPA